jgi:predicted Fe-S protein YdhL (DUF1289 family)
MALSGDPASPCIRLCALDPASGLCRGCRRSLDEIASWPTLDAAAKRRILAELPARSAMPKDRPSPA